MQQNRVMSRRFREELKQQATLYVEIQPRPLAVQIAYILRGQKSWMVFRVPAHWLRADV